jgi:hypothetical protein
MQILLTWHPWNLTLAFFGQTKTVSCLSEPFFEVQKAPHNFYVRERMLARRSSVDWEAEAGTLTGCKVFWEVIREKDSSLWLLACILLGYWLLLNFQCVCEHVINVSSREMYGYCELLCYRARSAGRKIASPRPSLCTYTIHGQQNTRGSLTALGDNLGDHIQLLKTSL